MALAAEPLPDTKDEMHEELLKWLIRDKLLKLHPLPWRMEQDWTDEVYDADGALVIKLPRRGLAQRLIFLAQELEAEPIPPEIQKLLEA